MRLKQSVLNAKVSTIMYTFTILIGFISQSVFLKTLGEEYLGLNGLFSNIISVLSIVELGFGTAIVYNLYQPLYEDNKEKVKSIIAYYKKIYRIIALIVFSLGIGVLPFLKIIVGEVSVDENIQLIFFLYLMDTVASYLLTYKRSILYADQKVYLTNIVHIGYLILMNGLQILDLLLINNFIIYLLIKIFCRILENIIITIVANNKYPYLKERNISKLSSEFRSEIITKVKGLLLHQIGSAFILGTDNIIISMAPGLGVVSVGLYSNYNLIIMAVYNVVTQTFSSITAGVANLLVENNSRKSYEIYKNMLLLNSWIFSFVAISVLSLIEPFIILWIGSEYLLSKFVLIVLVIDLYIRGMRNSSSVFKNAAGIFYEDRYVPLIESAINLIFSIIFVRYFGLAGVFMGTIMSSMVLFGYSYPKYVYKGIFKKNYLQYSRDYLQYIFITMLSAIVVYFVTETVKVNNPFVQLFINGMICLIFPNLIYYLFFHKTDEYKYCKNIVMQLFGKFKRK